MHANTTKTESWKSPFWLIKRYRVMSLTYYLTSAVPTQPLVRVVLSVNVVVLSKLFFLVQHFQIQFSLLQWIMIGFKVSGHTILSQNTAKKN